jgi:hypothetical protein
VSLRADLDKLLPGLSARERAILVLRNFKEKKPQDPTLAWGMADYETREYNRLIRYIQVCNSEVFTLITMIQGRVDVLSVRLSLLLALNMWGEHADMLSLYLRAYTKEPITESEYKRRQEEEPKRWAPVSELAQVMTSRKGDWNVDALDDPENQIVNAAAWEKECARQEKVLLSAARRGELESKGRGKDLTVRVGSFWAWLGEEVNLRPAWGFDFDLAPDDEADLVEKVRRNRDEVKDTFSGRSVPDEPYAGFPLYWLMAARVQEIVTESVPSLWTELMGLDGALREIAKREFGGEDPLKVAIREDVDRVIAKLKELHSQIEEIVGPVPLPEVGEDKVQENLDYIEHFVQINAR